MPNTGENWTAVWGWAGSTDTNAWNPWHFAYWFCEAWASGVMGLFILGCLALMVAGVLCKDGSMNDVGFAFPFLLICVIPVWIVAMLPVVAPFAAILVVAFVWTCVRGYRDEAKYQDDARKRVEEWLNRDGWMHGEGTHDG